MILKKSGTEHQNQNVGYSRLKSTKTSSIPTNHLNIPRTPMSFCIDEKLEKIKKENEELALQLDKLRKANKESTLNNNNELNKKDKIMSRQVSMANIHILNKSVMNKENVNSINHNQNNKNVKPRESGQTKPVQENIKKIDKNVQQKYKIFSIHHSNDSSLTKNCQIKTPTTKQADFNKHDTAEDLTKDSENSYASIKNEIQEIRNEVSKYSENLKAFSIESSNKRLSNSNENSLNSTVNTSSKKRESKKCTPFSPKTPIHNIKVMNSEINVEEATEILKNICEFYNLDNPSLIQESIEFTSAAVQQIPKLENIILDTCEILFADCKGDGSNKITYLDKIIPTLKRWSQRGKDYQNLLILKRKICRLLKLEPSSISDQELLKRIEHLVTVASSIEGEISTNICSNDEVKFINQFKRLFDVKADDLLIIKLHQIYSHYHNMEKVLQNLKATLQLEKSAKNEDLCFYLQGLISELNLLKKHTLNETMRHMAGSTAFQQTQMNS